MAFKPESFFLLPNLKRLYLGDNTFLKGVLPKIHPSNTLLELDISYTCISGELPDSVGTLSSLNRLGLRGCDFSCLIPYSIGNLTQLRELDFDYNNFTGHIPDFIGNLTQLRELDFGYNNFTGHIPDFIGNLTQLRELDFGYNNFTGHIPDFIDNLTQLRELDFGYNNFTGHISDFIGNLTQLRELDLGYNNFIGHISDFIGNLTQLRELDFGYNNFTGHISDFIDNLTQLRELDFGYNNFTDHILDYIPDVFSNLQELVGLRLSRNSFIGPFPSSILSLGHLEVLDLSSNNITSINESTTTFPSLTYVILSPVLDLSNNKIHGPIPNWFSGMSESVPYCLGSMTKLLILDLTMNNFSGSLPPFCTQSTLLTTIVLNGNRFEGPIHVSLHNCVGLEVLDMGNNAINDTFPAWLGDLPELQVLILKSEQVPWTYTYSEEVLLSQVADFRSLS
ncbi:hypothetical protein RND71_036391 [Anisodus tanguticus]|uniref:Disease resistance R13L4/SHOC-2-like LRR domain-containing protein n=1 Tax=Anisodus tanguticus TaxID=243964 RepID=A0AAE1UU48_9SOLA|nr:hypothetical protein RND71_036391 [Anisodus tanguticus]